MTVSDITPKINGELKKWIRFSFQTLIAAIEDQNVDAYTDAVKDYDSISRLDQWTTTMLLRVKKGISEDDDLR